MTVFNDLWAMELYTYPKPNLLDRCIGSLGYLKIMIGRQISSEHRLRPVSLIKSFGNRVGSLAGPGIEIPIPWSCTVVVWCARARSTPRPIHKHKRLCDASRSSVCAFCSTRPWLRYSVKIRNYWSCVAARTLNTMSIRSIFRGKHGPGKMVINFIGYVIY